MADSTEIREVLSSYLRHWKWFLLSLVVAIGLAVLYLRYAVPKYEARAKIKIIEDQSSAGGLDLFSDIGMLSGGNTMVEDEVEVLNSRSNIIQVVRELGLNTKITSLGNIRDTEMYDNPPINLNFLSADSVINRSIFSFFITGISETSFRFSNEEDGPAQLYAFGKTIETPLGDLVITPNFEDAASYEDRKLKVSVTPVNRVAEAYQARVRVAIAEEYSNIVTLSLEDPNPNKARDFLNTLIRIYNENAIADKKAVADKTSQFINDRIAAISSNLTNVDESAEELKTERGLTDIQSEANINLNFGASNRQQLASSQTQLEIAASMQDLVRQQDGYEIMPTNIGLDDPTIASTTARYNQLVAERRRLMKSSTEKSPIIQNLDQELDGLKQSMQSSLNSKVNNLGMQVSTLTNQQAIINSKIYSAPRNERDLRDITRQQQTTESLYLYLLQKREEAQIAVASTAPKSQIIDSAYKVSDVPISPRRNLVFLVSFVFGLLVPFSVIYARDLLDNKIHSRHNLEQIIHDAPVLGELPRLGKKDNKFIVKDDRSILAESLRIIRTNLDYLLKARRGGGKNNLIFVTSGTPGEGKTFFSTNLSLVLSGNRKRVLLIGADIRNPKLYTYFLNNNVDNMGKQGRNKDAGLTEYLYDDKYRPQDIINSMLVDQHAIDVIFSGRIPPNPAELLMNERMKELLDEMSREYDYVVVDTAPILVVTDTLLFSDKADLMVYVARAGVTARDTLDFPAKLKEEGKISNLAFIVNDVKQTNLGYGGKYGYGYSKSQKKWWKFR
ncbi:GumC family protein [Robiginitalea biformata]|uniref:GumC family protein n=1 Tax=Robiginitalea biformata TaxID=252307 RepID=UPI003CCC2F99